MKMPNSLSSKDLLNLYYFMRLNRAVEDRLIALYRQSIVTATVFSSRGQEATSVGSAYALGEQDFVSPITRNLGTMLVRGIAPRDIFTQYMGKATSPTKGKERIHYFGDLNKGVVASLSILGDMIPVMAGIALAAKMKNKPSVALTYIGEGASATGNFHEGVNLASVLGLAFVLIIENNQYAYDTGSTRRSRTGFCISRPLLRHSFGDRGRKRCAGSLRGDQRSGRARPNWQWADNHRSENHADAWTLGCRQFVVRAEGRT